MKKNNAWIAILCLIVLGFSCKKQVVEWDKEKDLSLDTSLLLYGRKLLSHTAEEATFQMEVVQLNGLEVEKDFENLLLETSPLSANPEVMFSNVTTNEHTPINSYSTIFLLEQSSYSLYAHGQVSFFMRRYFEQIDKLGPNKKMALATFYTRETPEFKFQMEGDLLFENSAKFKDSILIELIQNAPYFSESTMKSVDFKELMYELMDSLNSNQEVVGQKSITIFDDFQNGNSYFTYESIDSIINRAITDDIKINVVCQHGYNFFALALRTGGFIIDDREFNTIEQDYWDYAISSIGNGVASLDRLLSNDVTTCQFDITAYSPGASLGIGSYIESGFRFNDNIFNITSKIE